MRRLEEVHELVFSQQLAGDARTALAHFAIEVSGASVFRSSDARCHVVVPPENMGDVHVIGMAPISELMEFLRPMPGDVRIVMNKHMFSKLSHLVKPRAMETVEIYVGSPGMAPGTVPTPDPTFDVRPLLYSDIQSWSTLPPDAGFLVRGYGDPRAVLARGATMGAFNGAGIASIATAELGRNFATIWAYTVPQSRGRGLATQCVAALLYKLMPKGERPLFAIRSGNGSPDRAMARRFGLEQKGELASILRYDMAL